MNVARRTRGKFVGCLVVKCHFDINKHFRNKKVVNTALGTKTIAKYGQIVLQKANIKPILNGLSSEPSNKQSKKPKQNAPTGSAKTPKRKVIQ